jgi:RNA polymerase sigma factor (sigma-70 family)
MQQQDFLQLISQHQGIIYKICRIYRDAREDREDLFQEIIFTLWKSAPLFRAEASFSSWMYKVALNTAIASFRKKKPDIRYTGLLPDKAAETDVPDDQHEQLMAAIKRLNDADKALITLHLEGLSHREIAHITGITENNVAVKLSRIKTKLQHLLNSK